MRTHLYSTQRQINWPLIVVMAEAAVDLSSNMSSLRYFCHQCSQESDSVLSVSIVSIETKSALIVSNLVNILLFCQIYEIDCICCELIGFPVSAMSLRICRTIES